jgi:hypothetical protein
MKLAQTLSDLFVTMDRFSLLCSRIRASFTRKGCQLQRPEPNHGIDAFAHGSSV